MVSWFAAIVLALIAFRSICFLIYDRILWKADAVIAGVCLMGALLVYRHARLRLERTTREDPEQIERRLEELRSLAWTPDFELAVEGKSRLLPILCMFLASGAVLVPLVAVPA